MADKAFSIAVQALIDAHNQEINGIFFIITSFLFIFVFLELREQHKKEKEEWEKKRSEMEEQITQLRKDKHGLKMLHKKAQVLMDNYRTKLREGNVPLLSDGDEDNVNDRTSWSSNETHRIMTSSNGSCASCGKAQ